MISRVNNAYGVLNTKLGLPAPPTTLIQFVPPDRYRCWLSGSGLSPRQTLAEEATDATLTAGVHPAGFAAACVYRAADEHCHTLTQSNAVAAASETPATIRTHRETLRERVE